MSNIMPDRVADLIPSQRPKPAPAKAPLAVSRLSAKQRPLAQIEAAAELDSIESRLKGRDCPSLVDPARETLLARWSAADKALSGVALRQATEVLS